MTNDFQQDTEKTIVIFRKWFTGDVIALFPELSGNYNASIMNSYEHVGQHGSADSSIISITSLATEKEYAELKKELESYPFGYNLDIRQKMTYKMYLNRKNNLGKVY